MLNSALIHVQGVRHVYAGQARPALDDVTLEVQRGEFLAIRGKSGSGKTTLLNLLGGLDRPSRGDVRIADASLTALSEAALTTWRGRHVGIVFQFFQLLPTLSALENVIAPMEFVGRLTRAERMHRARGLLRDVGVDTEADKRPTALSGGQQQRVALARALANDPVVVLADEPTGNLDSQSADQVLRALEAVARRGTTVVMITHDADAASRAARVVSLADGRVVDDRRQEGVS